MQFTTDQSANFRLSGPGIASARIHISSLIGAARSKSAMPDCDQIPQRKERRDVPCVWLYVLFALPTFTHAGWLPVYLAGE
jgi:hypothetical protein